MKSVKWTMLSNKEFTGELGGYQIAINSSGAMGYAYWIITKDTVVIDECYRHSPLNGELQAKGYTQKLVQKLLTQLTP